MCQNYGLARLTRLQGSLLLTRRRNIGQTIAPSPTRCEVFTLTPHDAGAFDEVHKLSNSECVFLKGVPCGVGFKGNQKNKEPTKGVLLLFFNTHTEVFAK